MKRIKSFLKIFSIAALSIILLITAAIVYAGSSHFEKLIKNHLEKRFSNLLKGQVTIGELDISSWTLTFLVKDLTLQHFSDRGGIGEVHVGEIKASFRLLSLIDLYSGSFNLSELVIQEPKIHLKVPDLSHYDHYIPSERTLKTRIIFGVSRLDIVHGQLVFQEEAIPLDISAQDLNFTLKSFPLLKEGHLTCLLNIRRAWRLSNLFGNLEIHFKKHLHTVELVEFLFQSGKNHIHAKGKIPLRKGQEYHLELTSTMESSELIRPLLAKNIPLNGFINVSGTMRGELLDPVFEGHFSSQEWLLYKVQGKGLKGHFNISKKGFRMDDLSGYSLGGSFHGSVEGNWEKDKKTLDLAIMIDSVDLYRISQLNEKLPFGIHGIISGKTAILMNIAPFKLLDGEIDMDIQKKKIDETYNDRNIEGEISIAISKGEIHLEKAILQSDSISLKLKGIIYPLDKSHATFTLGSSSLKDDVALLEPLLKKIKKDSLREEIMETIDGNIRVTGSMRWDKRLNMKCDFDFSHLSLFHQQWGDLSGTISVQGKRVECQSVQWQGPQGSASMMGTFIANQPIDYQWRGHVENLPLQSLIPILEKKIDLKGSSTFSFSLMSHKGKIQGHLTGEVQHGEFFQEPFDEAKGHLEITPQKIIFPDWKIVKGKGMISISGEYSIEEKWLTMMFEGRKLETSDFVLFRNRKMEIKGQWNLRGHASMRDRKAKAFFEAQSENVSLGPLNVGKVSAQGEMDQAYLFYSISVEEWNSSLSGVILLEQDFPFEGSMEFSNTDYELLKQLMHLETADIKGNITGNASYSGELKKLKEIAIKGEISAFEIQAAQRIYTNASPLSVLYTSGAIQAEDLQVVGENTELYINLLIDIEEDKMNLDLQGNFDLNIIDAFTKNISSYGKGEIVVTADGPFKNPDFHGEIKVYQGMIRHFSLPYPINNLSFQGHFDRDFFILPSIDFEFAGGQVHGNGIVSIQKLGYEAYSLELSGKDISMKFPEGIKYSCDPELFIRGDRSGIIISGDVSIIRGLYYNNFGFESQFMASKSREYQPFMAQEMPENIFLDLDMKIDEGFWVKNDLVNAELTGNLHIGGDVSQVEVTGRLSTLEGGSFEIRDVRYEIKEAHIDFSDLTRIFPSFDITAQAEVSNYKIELRVTGNMEKFEYHLTSDPPLPSQDIIALLITGTTLETLGQEGTSVPSDLAARYLAGTLSKTIEKKLQKQLHLDKVRIDPMLINSQTDPTARMTFGKKLSEQLMFIYSIDLTDSERNVYQIDYNILKNLHFTAERTEIGALGGELRHRTHYTMRKALLKDEAKKVGKTQRDGLMRVTEITIESDGPFSGKKFLKKLPFKKGKPYHRKLVLEGSEKLKSLLIEKGFLEAMVKHEIEKRESGYRIYYIIHEGKKIDILLKGVSKQEEKKIRKKIVHIAMESVFPQEMLQDIEGTVRGFYQENGFYAVDVFRTSVDFENRKEVVYTIDKGDQVKVENVIITGNKAFPDEKIYKQMLIKESTLLSQPLLKPSILKEDILAIENLYRENGYARVLIDEPAISLSADGEKATITVNINEGSVVMIREVIFQGHEIITPEELFQKISSSSQSPLIPSYVQRDELALQQFYDSKGFPDAWISSEIRIENGFADLIFHISEGGRKKVGEVTITGNELTRTKIINRELLFQKGDDLSKETLLKTQHALYKMGLFKSVSITRIASDTAGLENIRVKVEEADNVHLSWGGGFDNLSGPRGYIEVSNTNFFGYDRFVSLLVRASSKDSRVHVIVKEPRLFTRKLDSIFTSYLHREEKESFTERIVATSFQVEKKLRPKWTRYIRYKYQNVEISDLKLSLDEIREKQPNLEDLKLSDVGLSFIRDGRDDPFNPEKGTYASADGRVFSNVIGSEADFVKLYLQGSYFKNLGKNVIWASSLRLGASNGFSDTKIVPLSERFFAGGDSSMRGFERDMLGPKDPITGNPVGGEFVFLINEELRFPIFASIRGVLFYDAGNVYFRMKDFDLFDIRHVIGAGLRVKTPIGPFRFEYGRKIDRRDGESKGEFYISIGHPF